LIGTNRVNLIVGWCGQFLFFVVPRQFSQDIDEWPENQILIPDWTYFHCPGATLLVPHNKKKGTEPIELEHTTATTPPTFRRRRPSPTCCAEAMLVLWCYYPPVFRIGFLPAPLPPSPPEAMDKVKLSTSTGAA